MAYRDIVQSDSPIHYWTMADVSGSSLVATAGGVNLSLGTTTAKPTLGAAGFADGYATSFDGSSDIAYAAIDLSGQNALVVEFLLYTSAWLENAGVVIELGIANFAAVEGGFAFAPHYNAVWYMATHRTGASDFTEAWFTRPSVPAFHHYAVTLQMSAGPAQIVSAYVDGVSQSLTRGLNDAGVGNFANTTLTVMCRDATGTPAQFAAGSMQHLAIYSSLSEARIQAHAAAVVAGNKQSMGMTFLT